MTLFTIWGLKKVDHVYKTEETEALEQVTMKQLEREKIIGQGPKCDFAWDGNWGPISRVTSNTEQVMINLRVVFNYERNIYVGLKVTFKR